MVDFSVDPPQSELVSDLLWSLGVVAIEEFPTSDDRTTLRTCMGDEPDHAIANVIAAFPDIRVNRIDIDRAVADTWREHAVATWVNDDVALVPAWISAPTNCFPIYVEPLDTFGLGNHPTTVLTLRLALKHVVEPCNVFDLGCGSGVLAVGLAVLKKCSCSAYDIAESAQKAVANNARLNNTTLVSWSNGYPQRPVDVVLANILAPVLIEESDKISSATNNGGLLVLSGMRTEQVDRVLQEFTGFIEIDRANLDGWTAVALRKK